MGSVARAIETTEVTGVVDWYATEMGAHTEGDEESVIFHTVFVSFLVTESADVNCTDL